MLKDKECMVSLRKNALGLINRLQKNKEYYKKSRDDCLDKVMFIAKQCDELEAEKQSLKAEIERLQGEIKKEQLYNLRMTAHSVKAEAVKEFAERLKAEYSDFDEKYEMILPENIHKAIDDLLKEMVG